MSGPVQPDAESSSEKMARNALFAVISRSAMIFATAVGLPAAAWMMNRAVSSVDIVSAKVDAIRDQSIETGGTMKLIQQSQETQSRMLADHEARVRVLENYYRNAPSRNN